MSIQQFESNHDPLGPLKGNLMGNGSATTGKDGAERLVVGWPQDSVIGCHKGIISLPGWGVNRVGEFRILM